MIMSRLPLMQAYRIELAHSPERLRRSRMTVSGTARLTVANAAITLLDVDPRLVTHGMDVERTETSLKHGVSDKKQAQGMSHSLPASLLVRHCFAVFGQPICGVN